MTNGASTLRMADQVVNAYWEKAKQRFKGRESATVILNEYGFNDPKGYSLHVRFREQPLHTQ